MTRTAVSALPPDHALARAKADFIRAAHAASPLRAVEKSPWVAVSATAALTMGATVVAAGTGLFGRTGGGLMTQGLALATALLKSRFAGPIMDGIRQGVASAASSPTAGEPSTP